MAAPSLIETMKGMLKDKKEQLRIRKWNEEARIKRERESAEWRSATMKPLLDLFNEMADAEVEANPGDPVYGKTLREISLVCDDLITILKPEFYNPLAPFGLNLWAWHFKVATIGYDNHAFFSDVSGGNVVSLDFKSFLGAFAYVLSQILPLEVIEKKLEELCARGEKG